MLSRILLFTRLATVRLGWLIGRVLPVRPVVVLATSHAARPSGNLAVIGEELRRRRPSPTVVVLASDIVRGDLDRIRALYRSIVAGFRLATSRVFIVDDYYFPLYAVPHRRATTVIQVWHACGAFKKFGYSVLDATFGATEEFVARVPIHTNYDVCFVSSMNVAPAYADAFRQPLEKFTSRFGIPRTDVFFGDDRIAAAVAAVRRGYAIPPGRRVVLYAPTFRGESISRAAAPTELDLGLLRRSLGDDHVLLLRLHPFVRSAAPLDASLDGFVIDVSDHPDINELMLASDVLVTDYSSAIYEFSLLGRPMAFFAPDLAAYEGERGFYFDYRSGVPGPIFETTEALAGWLRSGEFDLARVESFRARSFDVADGHATARTVDELILPALAGRTVRLGGPPGASIG